MLLLFCFGLLSSSSSSSLSTIHHHHHHNEDYEKILVPPIRHQTSDIRPLERTKQSQSFSKWCRFERYKVNKLRGTRRAGREQICCLMVFKWPQTRPWILPTVRLPPHTPTSQYLSASALILMHYFSKCMYAECISPHQRIFCLTPAMSKTSTFCHLQSQNYEGCYD